jgi:hypothetical protein
MKDLSATKPQLDSISLIVNVSEKKSKKKSKKPSKKAKKASKMSS